MSLNGTTHFGEQSAVAATYVQGTNRISFPEGVRRLHVIAKGAGEMVFFVANSSDPATDLADATKRYKLASADPTVTDLEEYCFEFPSLYDTFDFLSGGSAVEVYATGETI